MSMNKWGRWGAAMWLVLGCGSKLQVDANPPGGAGAGAAAGAGAVGGSDVVVSGGSGGFREGGGAGGTDCPCGGTGAGDPGGSGQLVIDPVPNGTLGQPCLPSSITTEAVGSVAQADIVELARCSDGSTCGPDGLCTEIPDCPSASGACVVRHAVPGAGGSGGAAQWSAEDAYGGTSFGGNGEVRVAARDRAGVQGLAADDSNLYWVEYGTRDSLGNYQNDGALFSQALSGGAAKQITTGLPGPVALGLTSSHAYVFVDGAPLVGSDTHPQLVRVLLAGGATEPVQDGPISTVTSFTGVGDVAFWTQQGKLYEQAAEVASTPTVFLADWVGALTSDGRDLFYGDSIGMIWRAPLDGGAAQALALEISPFEPSGDFIYGLENIANSGMVLDRAPFAGNSFQRTRALGAGSSVGGFQIIGDRFFVASNPPDPVSHYLDQRHLNITTGSLSSSDPPVRLLEAGVPSINQPLLWVATADTLYWSDGRSIYARPVTEPR